MSKHDPKVALRQVIEHARRAQELCEANSLGDIVADWQKCAPFERVMEVLGEAVKRLPSDLTARYPAVDWRGIVGMRDRVSHGYDSIDHDLLWQAVESGVPGLLATVAKMLEHLEGDSPKSA